MEYASQYYSVLALGAPFIILSFTPNNVLRTEGFSFDSMLGGVIGSCVNIVLDPIFISVFGWGAAGAAIATVIGYICTDAYYIRTLLRRPKYLSIHPKWLHIKATEVWPVLAIGIPAAITNLTQSFGTTLLNHYICGGACGCVSRGRVRRCALVTADRGYHYGGDGNCGFCADAAAGDAAGNAGMKAVSGKVLNREMRQEIPR